MLIDGEETEGIGIALSEGTEGQVRAVGVGKNTTGIKYTVTLTNFEQGRKGNRTNDFKEWSGNIELVIDEGDLSDTFGNLNFENTVQEKESDGQTKKIYDKETSNIMFKDNINPEITYKFADTTIDQATQTVTAYFDIVDKYTTDPVKLNISDLGLIVDTTQMTNPANYLTLTYVNDISEEINGRLQKVGERFKLEIKNLEEIAKAAGADYRNYSGPLTITFAEGCVEDKSGNKSGNAALTFTIGVDNPGGDAEDDVIVDFVKPVWEYVDSSIIRNRDDASNENQVKITVKGSDKYLNFDESNLTASDIKVFIDGVEDTTSKVTVNTPVQITPSNPVDYSETFEITLSDFKSNFTDYGTMMIRIAAGTLKDRADKESEGFAAGCTQNLSIETDFYVGNDTWVEQGDDTTNPKYTAFRNDIVDFEKPVIKYQYSSTNPSPNYTNDRLTVVFDVLEKYFYTDGLTMKPDGAKLTNAEIKENLRIIVDGDDISDQVFGSANTKLTATNFNNGDAGIGKRYTLIIDNFEIDGVNYNEYSGPVELSFKAGIVADTSGNLSEETSIVLDKEDGNGSDPLIIDLINPVWEDINASIDAEGNGTGDVTFIRKRDFPDDPDTVNTVIVDFRGTDKYLDKTTVADDLERFESKIKILDESNNDITNKFTKVLELESTEKDYEVKYQLTLTSDYFEEYSGKLYVVVPKDEIKDTASDCNEALNASADKKYEIPLVDFVKPKWEKQIGEFSKIIRTRDDIHNDDTVEIKLISTDKYMDKTNAYGSRLLAKEDITLYLIDSKDVVEEISKDTMKLDSLMEI